MVMPPYSLKRMDKTKNSFFNHRKTFLYTGTSNNMKKYLTIIILGLICIFNLGCSQATSITDEQISPQTPPMGWNSWNHFKRKISAKLVKEIADGAKRHKLNEAGYKYLVIDDVWQADALNPDGTLAANPETFPDGIAPLAEYVRQCGFELGIYSSPNLFTCAGYPATLGFEEKHAKQFADWGCKFVKYDFCPNRNDEYHLSYETVIERYRVFGEALRSNDPDIIFAICEKGFAGKIRDRNRPKNPPVPPLDKRIRAFVWCKDVGGVMWRTTMDIKPTWEKIMQILDQQEGLEVLCGPGAFNDPDMLEVGNGDLTLTENRAHFSLWCVLNAPLMLGNDLRDIPKNVLKVITNKEVIALNQDPLCVQAKKVFDNGDIEIFTKPLFNGDIAVCVLNRGPARKNVTFSIEQIGLDSKTNYNARDLWRHKDLGQFQEKFKTSVRSHDITLLRISPINKTK